jgi:hypothetical protein
VNKRKRERKKERKKERKLCLVPEYVAFSRLSILNTLLTIPLSVLLLVSLSIFDFIGYFHTCCSSFLFLFCICLLSYLFGVHLQAICPEGLVYVLAFLPSYFLLCIPIILNHFAVTHQLLNKQSLKYFMNNKCVVSLCTQFVYRGFRTANDYGIFYEICVITSSIKIKYFLFD